MRRERARLQQKGVVVTWLDERCPDCGAGVNIRGCGPKGLGSLWHCNADLSGGCGWRGLHAPSWYAAQDEQRRLDVGCDQMVRLGDVLDELHSDDLRDFGPIELLRQRFGLATASAPHGWHPE